MLYASVLFIVDLAALAFLFYLLPRKTVSFLKSHTTGIKVRPLKRLIDELPGVIAGTAIAALCFYLFGASYEEFAVTTARRVGSSALEFAGLDDITQCTSRVIEKYKFTPDRFIDFTQTSDSAFQPTLSESELLKQVGSMIIMVGSIPNDQEWSSNVMMESLRSYCRDYAAEYQEK